jgi:hypothetical protein
MGGELLDLHSETQERGRAGEGATTHDSVRPGPSGGSRVRLEMEPPVCRSVSLQEDGEEVEAVGVVLSAVRKFTMRLKLNKELIPSVRVGITRECRKGRNAARERGCAASTAAGSPGETRQGRELTL